MQAAIELGIPHEHPSRAEYIAMSSLEDDFEPDVASHLRRRYGRINSHQYDRWSGLWEK